MSEPARQDRLTPDVARWLVSEDGRDRRGEALRMLRDGDDALTAGTRLRERGVPADRAASVLGVADAALRMPAAWAQHDDLVFTRAALEQSSDPVVSRWRAQRFPPDAQVADLCAGCGGDTIALARDHAVVAVERDEARAVLAAHNAAVATGGAAAVVVGDALRPPTPTRYVHVDPGRRRGGRRVRRLSDYVPAVGALVTALSDARVCGLVLSPAVDLGDPDLPADVDLEFVQVGARLVEATAWFGRDVRPGRRAVLLDEDGGPPAVLAGPPGEARPVGPVARHLVEVAPAAVRARLHDAVAADIGAHRVAARRALFTVDVRPPPSPWYRVWTVEAVLSTRPKELRRWLNAVDARPVEFASAGAEVDVDALWRALGRPPRGPQGRRLLAVRMDEGTRVLALVPTEAA